MADYTFPDDLTAAQTRLHQATAELAALCRSLPWSVEPMDGWEGETHPHTGAVTGGRPASPGWTDEEKAAVDRLRAECRTLSATVTVHEHWAMYSGEDVYKARQALKAATRPSVVPVVDVAAAA
ncbi:hypothetical protein [Streptomyces sp. t39]|uniref:hypothetical protein n=1 Tax=Streptomyces sp. t39 TaxID=1828156 RepID=UPI0011CEB299|nr:hypothetical protein [Streptomyces sp. t39]TXS50133.1 hypothetical protein EAO77_27885 [Streptomyces sp. t39]